MSPKLLLRARLPSRHSKGAQSLTHMDESLLFGLVRALSFRAPIPGFFAKN